MSGQDSTRRSSASAPKRRYDFRIDAQGRWFCQGNQVTEPDLMRLLGRGLDNAGAAA